MRRIVIDTNVLVAAMRSDLGAAHKLVSLVGNTSKFEIYISVPLTLEYEEVLSRRDVVPFASQLEIYRFINALCSVAVPCEIFYLWRPQLRDPDDEMLVELAMAGGCDTVVTYNRRDFVGTERLGLRILSPKQFLKEIGELS